MKILKYLIIAIIILVASACKVNYQRLGESHVIKNDRIKIALDTVKGFPDLINNQDGYGNRYQKLIDSLNMQRADTVGFFIRPCFTHRGVLFKIENSKCSSYYFNFSSSNNHIVAVDSLCNLGKNYFSFICDDQVKKKAEQDSVILIPDCPVTLFVKLNHRFYYRKISGIELKYFSSKSNEFNNLLNLVVQ